MQALYPVEVLSEMHVNGMASSSGFTILGKIRDVPFLPPTS